MPRQSRLGSRKRRGAAWALAAEAWLVDRLVHSAGLNRGQVLGMTSEQAVDAWTDYITGQR